MKKKSFKGLLAMAALIFSGGLTYASPAETITMTFPSSLIEMSDGDGILSFETDWSQAVNVDSSLELELKAGDEVVATGKFDSTGSASIYANITLDVEEPYNIPGEYSMTIPAGAVFDGKTLAESMATNKEAVIYFKINEGGGTNIDIKYNLEKAEPADGSDLTSISVINTYWDGPVEDAGIGSGMVILSKSSGDRLQTVDLLPDGEDWSLFTATFEEVTEPGEYQVIFPAGIITYDGDPASPEVVLNYTIGGGSVKADEIVLKETVPANGSNVTQLDRIEVFWSVNEVSTDSEHIATVTNEKGEEVATAEIKIDDDDWNNWNKVLVVFKTPITTSGTYKIIIPAGAVTADEGALENDETILTYTIDNGGSGTVDGDVVLDFQPIKVYPENGTVCDANDLSGMSDLTYINIYFSSMPYIKKGYEFVFTNENGEKFPSTLTYSEEDIRNYLTVKGDGYTLILGLEDIPSGKYTLTVPKGMIGDEAWEKSDYTKGHANDEFSYSWTYIAKEVVEIPEDVINAPLELELLTINLPNGKEVNLLDKDASLETLPPGCILNIKTNKDEYAQSLLLNFKDNTTGEIMWTVATLPSKDPTIPSIGIKGEDGIFHFEKAGTDIILYSNNTYSLVVSAYVNFEVPDSERIFLQATEVEIKGGTKPIEYSNVEILGVTPEPGTVFDTYIARSFSVVYDAPVQIVTEGAVKSGYNIAYMGTQPFEKISSNDDKTVWTFTLPESELNDCLGGGIVCNVVANDMEGRRVYPKYYEYNVENYADGFQQYVYNCYLGCPKVTVVPASGIVAELDTFEFTCPEADKESIVFQGIDNDGNAINITVVDASGKEVAVIDRNNYEMIDNNGKIITDDSDEVEITVVKIIMHLDKKVTETGEYTLVIPSACFMTGTEFLAYGNCPQKIKYTVDPDNSSVAEIAGEDVNIAIVDGKLVVNGVEGNVDIYSVNGVKVASVAGNSEINLEKGIYVVVANGKSIKVVL